MNLGFYISFFGLISYNSVPLKLKLVLPLAPRAVPVYTQCESVVEYISLLFFVVAIYKNILKTKGLR